MTENTRHQFVVVKNDASFGLKGALLKVTKIPVNFNTLFGGPKGQTKIFILKEQSSPAMFNSGQK